jgi:hypothetical protein
MCSPITGMCTRGRAAAHVNKLGITDLIGGSIPTPGGCHLQTRISYSKLFATFGATLQNVLCSLTVNHK